MSESKPTHLFIFIIAFLPFTLAQGELSLAIKNYDFNRAKTLITTGIDVNAKNQNGATPLMEAVITNQLELSLLLLDAGADLNARLPSTNQGSSVTNFAAQYASPQLVQTLLERGAHAEGSLLALAYLSRQSRDSAAVVQLLLDSGAKLDDTLHFYDLFNERSLINYFPCVKDTKYAPYNNNQHSCTGAPAHILELLDSPNINYLKNTNSLAFAAMFAGPQMMQALLENGANPNESILRNMGNQAYGPQTTTPLELALYKQNHSVIPLLLNNGARLDLVDPKILEFATLNSQLEARLRQAGVDTLAIMDRYNSDHQACSTPVTEKAFVSFILDDGEYTDNDVIERIFKSRNVTGTIAAVSSFVGQRHYMTVQELEALEQIGWEIASHTRSHENLSTLNPVDVEDTIRRSYTELQAMGLNINVLVYPFGAYNQATLSEAPLYYQAAFTGGYKLNNSQTNPFILNRYNISNKHSYQDYLSLIDKVIEEESWLIWAVHTGYDLSWEQQKNLDALLNVLCEKGIDITTASEGLKRLQ